MFWFNLDCKIQEDKMDKKKCFVIMPFSKTTEEHDEAYWTEFFDTIQKIMEEKNIIPQGLKWDLISCSPI